MKYKILLRVKGNVVVKLLLGVYKNTKHLHLPSASLYISAKKKKAYWNSRELSEICRGT